MQNGQPYILEVVAGKAFPDERSRGYTLIAKTTFRNLEDMSFYDKECEAHKHFKALAAPRRTGDILTVYFEDVVAA